MDDAGRKALLLSVVMSLAFAGMPRTADGRMRHHRVLKPDPEEQAAGETAAATGSTDADSPLNLAAQGATVIDALTGVPIFEKNAGGRFTRPVPRRSSRRSW